jgi:nicotinic acid mononucleotide adenylyltransferase
MARSAERAEPIEWRRPPRTDRVVLLLGAFDPPTNAHVEILESSARAEQREPVWGMTKTLLDRPSGGLFTVEERIALVDSIAERTGSAFGRFEHGTYLEVDRALRGEGIDAVFIIGSDKLSQLRDPTFYPDGHRGVEATFAEVAFIVIDRDAPPHAGRSATKVRRLVEEGKDVSALVPPEVIEGLRSRGQGYTSAT